MSPAAQPLAVLFDLDGVLADVGASVLSDERVREMRVE